MPNQIDNAHLIRLGTSDLYVSRIGLGCWPMSGISSLGVTDEQSVATIRAALDQGINFFDTAYSYGYDGRSDRVLSQALGQQRSRAIIAHKVGTHWNAQKQRVVDGRPETLLQHAKECLERLGTDYVDVMYLHCPDPKVPIEESAGAIKEICRRGWARYAAVSNVTLEEANTFATICPIVAIQPYFNMFQQEAVEELQPFATHNHLSMVCYWILMKGLLSGHMARDHVFDPTDRRLSYPIFQGQAWQDAQDVLDHLRRIANEIDITVSQLVVAWSLTRPGVSVALLGAKRPEQIIESAQAMYMKLVPECIDEITNRLQT
ncbi:MAG: aldo/keto reductase [Planctomycetota bacterium]|nr:aldo/keto reductase [Planctomycetota bacterium]